MPLPADLEDFPEKQVVLPGSISENGRVMVKKSCPQILVALRLEMTWNDPKSNPLVDFPKSGAKA